MTFDIRPTIIEVLWETVPSKKISFPNLDHLTLLLEDGVIDSLSLIRFISKLEKKFSVRIQPGEINAHAFETVESVACLIQGKL